MKVKTAFKRKYLDIPTTQNVAIHLEPANVGDRILANILDSLIIFGLIIGLFFIVSFLERTGQVNVLIRSLLVIMLVLPYFFYHLLSEIFLNGQSIGKRQMKIRVVCLDGTAPRLSHYFMRWLLRFVDSLFFGVVAIVVVTLNNKGQRLGDMAAGTAVIKDTPNIELGKILAYEFLGDKNYQPVYLQAQMIPYQEIEQIKALIRQKPSPENTTALERFAQQYRKTLGISSKEAPYIFLKTLVQDFVYLTGT